VLDRARRPGIGDLAKVLKSSENAGTDLDTLLCSQILFWMLAATDGHAKNFSIQLLPGGRYRLAPLYDVMSMWPIMGTRGNHLSWRNAKLAMAVTGKNRHYALKEIQRRHFNATAVHCNHGPDAEPLIRRLIERTPGAIEAVSAKLPAGFSVQVAEAVFQGLQASANQLEKMPKS